MHILFALFILIVLAIFWFVTKPDKEQRTIEEEASMLLWHDAIIQQEVEGKREVGKRFHDELDEMNWEKEYITQDFSDYVARAQKYGKQPINAIAWSRLNSRERKIRLLELHQ